MGRYPNGVSMTHAADPDQPPAGTPWSPGYPMVYTNAGRPRVVLEGAGGRIDLSWEEWSDLVADVGQRFVALVLARPDVLETVRQAEQLAQLLMRSARLAGRPRS